VRATKLNIAFKMFTVVLILITHFDKRSIISSFLKFSTNKRKLRNRYRI